MKKQIVSTIFVMLSIGLLFTACRPKSKLVGDLKFDNITLEESQHLFADESKPKATMKIDFSFVKESTDEKLKDSINCMLQKFVFNEGFAMLDPASCVRKYADDYFSSYHTELEPMYQNESAEMGGTPNEMWFSYEHVSETKVEYYDKHLLTYRFYMEEYTGGAHPVSFTYFQNFDLRSLKQIELNDLLVGEYDEELTELLVNQLMKDVGASNTDELQEFGYGTTGEIIPTENFKLMPGGIAFLYNVYEIAPYVLGPVEIDLSFEQLEPLLNVEYMIIKELRGR
ncbi:MAG: DUF3298 and DUF4163 domain-containing protein [Bacteroidaceae bacterium]|nr:DUF3298 and DUF4163 domain-containing protein [Bacteroidaceae bacterium]